MRWGVKIKMLWHLGEVFMSNVYMSPARVCRRASHVRLMPATLCKSPLFSPFCVFSFLRIGPFSFLRKTGQWTKGSRERKICAHRQIVWYNVPTLRKVYAHDTHSKAILVYISARCAGGWLATTLLVRQLAVERAQVDVELFCGLFLVAVRRGENVLDVLAFALLEETLK